MRKILIITLALFLVFMGNVSTTPVIEYINPTLANGSTTSNNWVYVNVSSSENISQALLEWGNFSGFTNVTMTVVNTSANSYAYKNMTSLSDYVYNFSVYIQNVTGMWNQSALRFVTVDTIRPQISFVPPTDSNNTYINRNWSYVNVSISDTSSQTSSFIDWNKSLVGYWNFEDYVSDGYANDSSSYGNDGTINGAVLTIDCKFGRCLNFDGANDVVNISHSDSLSSIKDGLTYEAWVYLRSFDTHWWTVVGKECTAVLQGDTTGTLHAFVRIGGWYPSANASLVTNKWQHVAMTYDNTTTKLYINGTLAASVQRGGTLDMCSLAPVLIGAYNGKGTVPYNQSNDVDHFNGTIDEVRVYNRVLSVEEINASYNTGLYRLYHNFTNLVDGRQYEYYAYTIDSAGNTNQTSTRILTVDTTPPQISGDAANETSIDLNDAINISAIVTDPETSVTSVLFEITYPNGTAFNVTASNVSDQWNNYTVPNNVRGQWNWSRTFAQSTGGWNNSVPNAGQGRTWDVYGTTTIYVSTNGTDSNRSTAVAIYGLLENSTDNALEGYNLTFYNGTNELGNATTNSTGYATYAWNIPSNQALGSVTLNVTSYENASAFYRKSYNNTESIDIWATTAIDENYANNTAVTAGAKITLLAHLTYDNGTSLVGENITFIASAASETTLGNATTNSTGYANYNWDTTGYSGTYFINVTNAENSSSYTRASRNDSSLSITLDAPPYWSSNSTNTTLAGNDILFSVLWEDETALSGYIFSSNNSGTWQNESWASFTGTSNFSNITQTLNSTVGATIYWAVWANDTSGNMNSTGNLTLTITSAAPAAVSPYVGGGTPSVVKSGYTEITPSNVINLIKQLGYTTRQFYVTAPELAGVLAALDSMPTTEELSRKITKETVSPVKTLEGDVYTLASLKVTAKYGSATKVIIARGDLGVDSMTSVAYARALNAPILLVKPKELPKVTNSTLTKLGTSKVIIIGGPEAVSEDVESRLPMPERIGGENREETAVKVAEALMKVKKVDTVVVTDGQKADITAVMPALKYGAPIIYTTGDTLSDSAKTFLKGHKFKRVITVGLTPAAANEVKAVT